MITRISWGF